MSPSQIQAIASFLRVLNSLENLRSSTELEIVAADGSTSSSVARQLLDQAFVDLSDAGRVLSEADLHPDEVKQIELAKTLNRTARLSVFSPGLRAFFIDQSLEAQEAAREGMLPSM